MIRNPTKRKWKGKRIGDRQLLITPPKKGLIMIITAIRGGRSSCRSKRSQKLRLKSRSHSFLMRINGLSSKISLRGRLSRRVI